MGGAVGEERVEMWFRVHLLPVGRLDVVGRSRVQDRDPQVHVDLLPYSPRLNLKQTTLLQREKQRERERETETERDRQTGLTLWQPPSW